MALVMFDYDGVIADSFEVHMKSFLSAFHENDCKKVNTEQDILNLYEGNVYKSMAELGLDDGQINRILESYEKRQNILLDRIDFFAGMDTALTRISGSHKIYIITSNIAGAVLRVLDRYGLTCIEKVIGSETEKSKIKKIQAVMGLYPEAQAYYVGDTKGDIFEGKEAGALTVGVAWGWHGADKLHESNPDYLVFSPGELANILCAV
ncbi:HAD family hydrolase [Candidatus Formimonas warabiya]|uniref:Haloacid dehalogenase n=1 Tax=Formimonas warabiya TaxID=1761012 RepID=A0A3G1L0D3_FORW1|nr:HAD-IA family hydrolase [Candidatus Formimonas warabiya]ATW28117.1 haloacid dehalogenase [Candidatus Formimonas warabiya]